MGLSVKGLPIAVSIAFICVIVLFLIFKGGLFIYRITETGIKIDFFGIIRIIHVSFEDIEEIYKGSFKDFFHAKTFNYVPINLRSRLFGQTVVVKKRKGIVRAILITPEDIDGFLSEIQRKITKPKK